MQVDPFQLFLTEFRKASETEPFYAARCALATVDSNGHADVRFVLFKHVGRSSFTFFTNYKSVKAQQLENNPSAAIAFHWHTTGVQVRARGVVKRLPADVSDAYFATRARGSQIGAHASKQSRVLSSRDELEAAVRAVENKFSEVDVPRPIDWGGYELVPGQVEIWRDHPGRLHDREVFEFQGNVLQSHKLWP